MTATPATRSQGLHVSLWVVQGLLAAAFLMAGVIKTTQPLEELAKNMAWTTAVPPLLVRFIGASEFLGALGLVLPSLTRIKPGLTPLAGAALALVMLLAAIFHFPRGEYPAIGFNVVLGALAAFVAWGRLKQAPIAPRG